MALVESIHVELGTKMPAFELKDPSGKTYKSNDLYGEKGLLVAFTCNHCPYAMAIWPRLIRMAKEWVKDGLNTVGINPNIHPDYPEDAPDQMKIKIKKWVVPFPYLVDETQEIARKFKAQCTPDLYLYNAFQELIYHGRFDDNWKEESKVQRNELKEAVGMMVQDAPVTGKQHPAMGCSIKWRD